MFKISDLVVGLCIAAHVFHGGLARRGRLPEVGPIVSLYQWSYDDIAEECHFLQYKYGGVLVIILFFTVYNISRTNTGGKISI